MNRIAISYINLLIISVSSSITDSRSIKCLNLKTCTLWFSKDVSIISKLKRLTKLLANLSGALDDLISFPGFTPTGRTNCFQIGLSPRQRTVVPTQTFYQMQVFLLPIIFNWKPSRLITDSHTHQASLILLTVIYWKDYYMLCGLRFERWFRCDLVYHDLRTTKFD